MNDGARRIWQRKLEFLLAEEAKTADPARKFELQEDVAEAKAKLRDLCATSGPVDDGFRSESAVTSGHVGSAAQASLDTSEATCPSDTPGKSNADACTTEPRAVATLVIRKDHRAFGSEETRALHVLLARYIGIDPREVEVLWTKPGSVRVGIGLSTDDAEKLLERYAKHADELRAEGIVRILVEIPGDPQGTSVSLGRLPLLSTGLVGREPELQALDGAYDDPAVSVVSIVSWAGVGKTSLVAEWLARLAGTRYGGAKVVFDWSFYSQGTRRQGVASSDHFVGAALMHFRDPDPQTGSPWDRGHRLARLVAQERSVLVLDGLEPLQHPPGPLAGQLRDPAIQSLVRGLAQRPMAGLCVITTRAGIPDILPFHSRTVREWHLENLSEEAGVDLLRQAGADGTKAELGGACREVKGHALTLQLMGTYVAMAYGGDIRKRDRFGFQEADAEVQGGHVFRVIEAYERWLPLSGESGERGLAVLRLLGLFERPADLACLAALRREPVIPGLTDLLTGLSDEQWRIALRLLESLRLITSGSPDPESRIATPAFLDAHPLIREYFASKLLRDHPAAWRAGHRRLYEHLCETTEHRPDTLEGLAPLYQAVAHGCQAGLHQQACDDVYFARILRGTGSDGFYSTRKLGAMGADLGAVACFFDRPWSRLSPNLSASDQAWLLNEAATRLRALGRLAETVEPMRASLEMCTEQKNWKEAAIHAGNLGELELTLGEVSAAVADAEQSVTFADRSGEWDQKMKRRTIHADALHEAGRRDEARQLFAEAEALQAEQHPEYPRLYSLPGFRYCDLLLSGVERAAWQRVQSPAAGGQKSAVRDQRIEIGGHRSELEKVCREVEERAKQWFEWRAPSDSLLTIALDHLTLGRAALYEAVLAGSPIGERQAHIESAVDGLRKAGTTHHIPRGLITRAWQRQLAGDAAGAVADLDEAWEIAERGPMRLYMADVLLTRARLFGLKIADCQLKIGDGRERSEEGGYPWGSPEEDLAEARRLIEKCGYHRRDGELADAEAALKRGAKASD